MVGRNNSDKGGEAREQDSEEKGAMQESSMSPPGPQGLVDGTLGAQELKNPRAEWALWRGRGKGAAKQSMH